MEVKDINNTAALSMLTRGSNASANGSLVGDTFTSLLQPQIQMPDFSKEVKFAVREGMNAESLASSENVKKEDLPETVNNKDKGQVKDKEKDEPEKIEQKETSRPEKEEKVQNKEASSAEENTAEETDENLGDETEKKTEVNILPDLSMLFAAETQPLNSITDAAVAVEGSAVQAVQNTAAEGDLLQTPEAGAAILSQAENVQALNQQKTSGKIDISALRMTPEENVVEISPVVMEASGNISTSNKTVADAVQSAITTAGKENAVVTDDIAEALVKLDNINIDGEEIELDVKIKDDGANFSYKKTTDLSAAVTAEVEGSINAPEAENERFRLFRQPEAESRMANKNIVQNPNMPAQQSAGAQPVQNPAFNAVTAASSGNNTDIAAEVTKNATTEVKSVQMAQAAGGSEFVNAAKARTAEQLKSPVNDTYKGMSRETVEQVKVNITKSAVKGVDKIDISLKPEELGHIEIKMHLAKNGKLQAEIIASRPETMEMLQKEAQNLQRSFEDAGFQTDENSLSFSCREDNAQSGQQERNYEMRRFIGEALDGDFSNDNLSGYAESSWDGQSGLNIRV